MYSCMYIFTCMYMYMYMCVSKWGKTKYEKKTPRGVGIAARRRATFLNFSKVSSVVMSYSKLSDQMKYKNLYGSAAPRHLFRFLKSQRCGYFT